MYRLKANIPPGNTPATACLFFILAELRQCWADISISLYYCVYNVIFR